MFSRDYDFLATDGAGVGSRRDAIDGLSAIAAALDQGLDAAPANGNKLADAIAIGLGWLMLAAVIFYPALQLAAIALCAAFFFMRSFSRLVFGASSSQQRSQASLHEEQTYLAA